MCEIDIIAHKDAIMYFVEVKYRSSDFQGGGFDYITNRKLKQMNFAAKVWCQTFNWGGDYRLMAAAVSGKDSENIELIEIC